MKTWLLIAVLALLLSTVIFAEQQDKHFDIRKHSDSSFVLVGKEYGTNVGVMVSDNGLLLIDPMPGEESHDKLYTLIQGISNRPILYVVNTHNHEDHTGGNQYFNTKGANILDLFNVKDKSDADNNKLLLTKEFGLEVIKVKSHTDQDLLYYHPASNVLFVGDVFDNNWHPTFYAGGINGFTKTIKKILATGNQSTQIIPGHGAPASKDVVRAFYQNTLVWLKRVTALHQEKMSVEQMMKDKQINAILQRFNTEQRKEFIPERAFKRFIERTIEIVSIVQ